MTSLLLASAMAPGLAFKPGDRVLFYGDSITEHQRYTAYVEAYVRSRFPGFKIWFMGAGWAGDTVKGGSEFWAESGGAIENRVARDVAPRRATRITVMLGMNDAYYSPFNPEWLGWFVKDYRHMLDLMAKAAPGARFTLMSPSPWDDFTRAPSFPASIKGEGGYNSTLVRYGQAVAEEAKARGMDFIDLNSGMADGLKKAAKADPELAQKLISDWIHPDWSGAVLMSAVMLKGLGAPDGLWSVDVDLASKSGSGRGAALRSVSSSGWQQKDEGLPYPYDPKDPATLLAAVSAGLPQGLDRQHVTVRGLASGRWKLSVEGAQVWEGSAEDLAKGIDLPPVLTPMREDSLKILQWVKVKNSLQQARWREVERPLDGKLASASAVEKAMEKAEADIVKEIEKIARPRWRTWSLARA